MVDPLNMAKVLVVGGAGYVGSSVSAWLLDQGHQTHVLDNYSTGHKELVLGNHFYFASAGDLPRVKKILQAERFDCVFHFAAKSLVSESVKFPKEYHESNVVQSKLLIEAMLETGTRNLVFSSTCAVFGDPGDKLISESLEKRPLSPYGQTKLEIENYLEDCAKQFGLRTVALRYFNAAGADPKLRVGEWHDLETHLIPCLFRALKTDTPVEVYGTDYPTPDGTCIRDYVHVTDLAAAHGAAMDKLMSLSTQNEGYFAAFNLGSDRGFSVTELIQTAEKVTGRKMRSVAKPRRPGDPPKLIADSKLARQELGFHPKFQLEDILKTAWDWEKKRSQIHRPAIFLDRDGTLNEDPGYLNHPDKMKLLPKVGEALALLRSEGFKLVVVTNQSGVARGLVDIETLPKIHERLQELLRPYSTQIDWFASCLHHPDEDCECRKPKPKLILDSAKTFGFDLSQSYMLGDKDSDLGAGRAASLRGSVLVRTGYGAETALKPEGAKASFIANDILEAAHWIISMRKG